MSTAGTYLGLFRIIAKWAQSSASYYIAVYKGRKLISTTFFISLSSYKYFTLQNISKSKSSILVFSQASLRWLECEKVPSVKGKIMLFSCDRRGRERERERGWIWEVGERGSELGWQTWTCTKSTECCGLRRSHWRSVPATNCEGHRASTIQYWAEPPGQPRHQRPTPATCLAPASSAGD